MQRVIELLCGEGLHASLEYYNEFMGRRVDQCQVCGQFVFDRKIPAANGAQGEPATAKRSGLGNSSRPEAVVAQARA